MTIEEYRTHTLRTLPDLGRPLLEYIKNIEGMEAIGEVATLELGMQLRKNADKLNFNHMTSGLAGEIGELVQCIGTEIRHEVDKVNLAEELGDIYWYLANYANMREIPIPEVPQVDVSENECLDLLIIKIADLVDIVKKFTAYNKPIEKSKEVEAVYDIRVALLLVEQTYGLSGADIRARNIAKLKARYPEKFTEDLAITRNLEAERKTLE